MTGPGPDAVALPADGRFAVADVFYPATGGARAGAVLAGDPQFAATLREHTLWLDEVADYEPGALYRRELPALDAVLAELAELAERRPLDLLVVDGYVDLDPEGRPGLGLHAHRVFGVPVVGVAKTAFRGASHAVEVRRGGSTRPLYVTSAGLPPTQAAMMVQQMAGRFRLPDAVRRADQLSRGAHPSPGPSPAPHRPAAIHSCPNFVARK